MEHNKSMASRDGLHLLLPVGASVLERAPAEPSKELALELARRGGSDELVVAVGGPDALEDAQRERDAEPHAAAAPDENGKPADH